MKTVNLDIINKAFQIANEYGTQNIAGIARKIGCKVIKDSDVDGEILAPYELGATIYFEGKQFIIVDDTHPRSECRFTVAHELGHIFLEHIGHKGIIEGLSNEELEQQADLFALSLLYPDLILSMLCTKFLI